MNLTISELAKKWGKSRKTIYDRVNNGEISRNEDGTIALIEMIRIFWEPNNAKDVHNETGKNEPIQLEIHKFDTEIQLLKQELIFKNEKIEYLKKTIEELRQIIEDQKKTIEKNEQKEVSLIQTVWNLSKKSETSFFKRLLSKNR